MPDSTPEQRLAHLAEMMTERFRGKGPRAATYEEDEDGDVTLYNKDGQMIAWMDKTAWDALQAHQAKKVPTDG